ncbi:MAG: hypothetical protein ACJATI_004081 [Halioglobus sp.]|jgi:hypothetical protein
MIFFSSSFIFGQVPYTKSQLSLNANEFSQIFTDQKENTLDLTFRVAAIDSSHTLRLATSFGYSTVDDEVSHFAVRVGIDNVYRESGNWKFYSGIDMEYSLKSINDSSTSFSSIGLIPFLGFLYHIGPHFSISTEPSIGIFRETENFNSTNSDSEYRFTLVNLGQIKVGFHF